MVHRIGNDELVTFDQIIVGTHRKRRAINKRVRKRLGFKGSYPRPGEKVVCLKNDRIRGLRNGELYRVVDAAPDGRGFVEMVVVDEDGCNIDAVAPLAGFHGDGNGADLPEQVFDYGHAITCHKAQGSEFGSVCVFDESRVFREHEHRWLYTAITRAAERVTVVYRHDDGIGSRRCARRQANGSGWTARCPCHMDDSPSLKIDEGGDGRVLLKCHAGCSQKRLVDWHRIKDLT